MFEIFSNMLCFSNHQKKGLAYRVWKNMFFQTWYVFPTFKKKGLKTMFEIIYTIVCRVDMGDKERYEAMCSDLWPWYLSLFPGDPDLDRAKGSFCRILYRAIHDQFSDTGMFRAMMCWKSPDQGRAGMHDWEAYAQAVLRHCSYIDKSGIACPDNNMITDRPHYEDFVLERDLVEGTAATYVTVIEVCRSCNWIM